MRCLFFLAALGLSAVARADESPVTLDGGYRFERERASGLPASGWGAGVSIDLLGPFSLAGSYSRLSTDSYDDGSGTGPGRLEYTAMGADLGASAELSRRTAVSLSLGYVKSTTEGLEGYAQTPTQRFDGPAGSLMLNYRASTNVAFALGPQYSYIGEEPGWNGSATLGLQLLKGFWLDTNYWRGQTAAGGSLGLRANWHD